MAFINAAWIISLGVAVQPPSMGPSLDRRIALLDELTSVTRQECVGHDELIARYDEAIEGAADEENPEVAAMLRVGRERAAFLRFVQTDRRVGWDRFPADVVVLRTHKGADAADARETLDALERSVAGAVANGLPQPCDFQPTAREPTEPPPSQAPPDATRSAPPLPHVRPTQPTPLVVSWTGTEKALLGSGTLAGAAGLAAIAVGIVGPIAARNNSRIPADGPREAQQVFLNETVPRRATIALSLGSLALAAGVGLVVGALVGRRHRRMDAGRKR